MAGTEKTLSFVKMQCTERGAVMISGSVWPHIDSVGSVGPSPDAYDAYGSGYVFRKAGTGVYDVELLRKPYRIISAIGAIQSDDLVDLMVQAEHKAATASDVDKWTVRFRVFVGSTLAETDINWKDRFTFQIVADYSSA